MNDSLNGCYTLVPSVIKKSGKVKFTSNGHRRKGELEVDRYMGVEITLKEATRINVIKVYAVEKTLDQCEVKVYDERSKKL